MSSDSITARDQARIVCPEDFAAAFGVSRETIARLAVYETLLRQWQRTINLVAPGTLEALWHRHFADSAQLPALRPGARTWVDLGSGAGFPGLVVAILLADSAATPTPVPSPPGGGEPIGASGARPRVTLIESHARKCAFLRAVVRETGIAASVAVEILSIRIEQAATHASVDRPDVVSARALAPLDKLMALAAPLFAPHTVGLFLKGREVAAELEAARRAWSFEVDLVQSCTDREGRILVVSDLAPHPAPKSEGLKP